MRVLRWLNSYKFDGILYFFDSQNTISNRISRKNELKKYHIDRYKLAKIIQWKLAKGSKIKALRVFLPILIGNGTSFVERVHPCKDGTMYLPNSGQNNFYFLLF